MTSRCTCWPNCWRITVSGALPGRKPFKSRGAAQFLEARSDLFADALGGHLHLHAALQFADTLHGNLHVDPLS